MEDIATIAHEMAEEEHFHKKVWLERKRAYYKVVSCANCFPYSI